ncbi:MAG: hypothetical protein RH860_01860 [Cytophagales bacterium]
MDHLISISEKSFNTNNLLVSEMHDGSMGSLFIHSKNQKSERKFKDRIAEAKFLDKDSVPILVSLNVDQFDELFELDIWKVDYSRVIKFPEI